MLKLYVKTTVFEAHILTIILKQGSYNLQEFMNKKEITYYISFI